MGVEDPLSALTLYGGGTPPSIMKFNRIHVVVSESPVLQLFRVRAPNLDVHFHPFSVIHREVEGLPSP